MKRIIISVAIVAIFGTQNTALGFSPTSLGFNASNSMGSALNYMIRDAWMNYRTLDAFKRREEEAQREKIEQQKKLLEALKKQLEEIKKIHLSITGNRTKSPDNYSSFFLKNPELIYKKDVNSDIFKSAIYILQQARTSASVLQAREAIERRSKYAAAVDKAVSLQTFKEAESRFQKISELVEKINTTNDLKSNAELQAHLKGMLTMIQNETAKLQMITHFRNTEQTLINLQKQKRNVRILNSKNIKMPLIRSIK
ncbi:type IV secretion system protein VirB5 [Bartonella japonica]|uniref:Type IV secretion system protein VirB5 n=1 Tax=Bartonella japonica TaxID=357761 RepID=A0ABV2FLK8_9HYPH